MDIKQHLIEVLDRHSLPGNGKERAQICAERLATTKMMDGLLVVKVPWADATPENATIVEVFGDAFNIQSIAKHMSADLISSNRALYIADAGRRANGTHERVFATRVCTDGTHSYVIVGVSKNLSTFSAEIITLAAAECESSATGMYGNGWRARPSELVRIIQPHNADALLMGVFSSTDSMIVDTYTRAGYLMRSRRMTTATILADVAAQSSLMQTQQAEEVSGLEHVAALGMHSVAIVGITDQQATPVAAIGVASYDDLTEDASLLLLENASELTDTLVEGAELLANVFQQTASPNIELPLLAKSVGCDRMSVYDARSGQVLMLGSYSKDGSILLASPDNHERELVEMAMERNVSVIADKAAVVLLQNNILLYARDKSLDPMERLQAALAHLRGMKLIEDNGTDFGEAAA